MSTRRTNGTSQWPKGTSGNPAGRPPGSRNRSTALLEELLEGEGEQLIRKAVELALQGDTNALRLCIDRLVPPRKDRLINLDLPPVQTANDISHAMTSVVAAIAEGRITPNEGEAVANLLSIQSTVVSVADLERRLEVLEKLGSTEGKEPKP